MSFGAEHTSFAFAKLYVNGERLDMPASLYWLGKVDSARVQFPLYATLESLGCQVERGGQGNPLSTTVRFGTQEFVIKEYSYSSELYEEDIKIYDDLARPQLHGGSGVKGQLYLDEKDCEKVLTILGFNNITFVVDKRSRIVILYAESEG